MISDKSMILLGAGLIMFAAVVMAAPQAPAEAPMPYEYNYEVKDPEKTLFFNKNENGDESGRVTGGYQVLLPDGRLMKVEYSVDGESGFVPKISFEDNAKVF
ncbi:pro-resilin-like [Arctopsyche grandis]|uniref:pro-resilin-like n=1 Tax=Arctopsyche grandis TaxID=121162 RepID=UPI00406D92ED